MISKLIGFIRDLLQDKYIPLNEAIDALYKAEKELMPENIPAGVMWGWRDRGKELEKNVIKEYYLFNRGLQNNLYGKRYLLGRPEKDFNKIESKDLPCWTDKPFTDDRGHTYHGRNYHHLTHIWKGNDIVVNKEVKYPEAATCPGNTAGNDISAVPELSLYINNYTETKYKTVIIFSQVSIKRSLFKKLSKDIAIEFKERPLKVINDELMEKKEYLKGKRRHRRTMRRRFRANKLKNESKYISGIFKTNEDRLEIGRC